MVIGHGNDRAKTGWVCVDAYDMTVELRLGDRRDTDLEEGHRAKLIRGYACKLKIDAQWNSVPHYVFTSQASLISHYENEPCTTWHDISWPHAAFLARDFYRGLAEQEGWRLDEHWNMEFDGPVRATLVYKDSSTF